MLSDFAIMFIVLAPGLAALIAGLQRKRLGDYGAILITTGIVSIAALLSLYQLASFAFGAHHGDGHAHTILLAQWLHIGDFRADWAIRVDALSITMMAVVTSVSALVHIYSIGYMEHDPARARFFAYLSLFTFAMLMLVTANNFLQLFFGWEGVGLASYLLIGFWYQKCSANDAAIKAFVTNRVGDVGLALGVMAIYCLFGTIEFAPFFHAITHNELLQPIAFAESAPAQEVSLTFLGLSVNGLELIGVLLFIGAMGKSAQFLLHVWLPDAMEGPTPVSALIHAATMVTAGVYLVCLCSPLYEYAPGAAGFIAVIGAITALFAATVGLAQNDIKRVIAYSTCSQLGYMFFAAGIGAYQAAMFHLFTHAFFKALLFLGAGSVIHGMHDEQDMRKMGGLAKFMPYTYVVMIIGTLAITGVGIPETKFGFAGFFSKDAILETAYAAGQHGVSFGYGAFWFGVIAALLTSFYSWRLAYMTFHGSAKWKDEAKVDHHVNADDVSRKDDHDHHNKPHESPPVMLFPLIVLAIGAVFAGFVFYEPMVGHHAKDFWYGAIYTAETNTVLKDKYYVPGWVFWAPLIVTIAGFIGATIAYLWYAGVGARIAANGGPAHAMFYNKWYFDEVYNVLFVKGARGVGDFLWKVGDKRIIDGFGPNGIAAVVRYMSGRLSRMHSGYLYHYAFVILGAVAVFGLFVLFRAQGGS